jgi:hypothetical protein
MNDFLPLLIPPGKTKMLGDGSTGEAAVSQLNAMPISRLARFSGKRFLAVAAAFFAALPGRKGVGRSFINKSTLIASWKAAAATGTIRDPAIALN